MIKPLTWPSARARMTAGDRRRPQRIGTLIARPYSSPFSLALAALLVAVDGSRVPKAARRGVDDDPAEGAASRQPASMAVAPRRRSAAMCRS